jgi:hypothetical protein
MSQTTGWLVEPTDEDRASKYADAADECEAIIHHLARAREALAPLERETARRERFGDLAELIDDHWIELRELEREHSDQAVSVPSDDTEGDTEDWKARQAEREALPEGYEPTPMPEIEVLGTVHGNRILVRCERTEARHVKNRNGTTAHQWFAEVPRATDRTHVDREWIDFDAGERSGQAAELAVPDGGVIAAGSKRDDANRRQEYYRVTRVGGLDSLGVGRQGRNEAAAYLRERDEDADNEEGVDGS